MHRRRKSPEVFLAGVPLALAGLAHLSDEEIVNRVLEGDVSLFEIIIRRHNQLLYRVTRSILGNDTEAEDVMQETYVRAYEHLDQFAGRSQFRTWLTRIAVNEALARSERGKRFHQPEDGHDFGGDFMDLFSSPEASPEEKVSESEMRGLLEQAIARLPEAYRSVLLLRDVEEISIEEVARMLNLTEATVKVRLHRARRTLRRTIFQKAGKQLRGVFSFDAVRCDRIVACVFRRIAALTTG
jgi:RNA polymerase sigma-70 factor, ECF subfamily